MAAECNGCGACCEVVPLSYTQSEAQGLALRGEVSWEEARWVVEDLVPISRRVVKESQPFYLQQNVIPPPDLLFAGEVGILPYFYTCTKWDPETRLCTDYENRPPPCRKYPWYDEGPNPAKALPPTCSYREDVGLPVELGPTRSSGTP